MHRLHIILLLLPVCAGCANGPRVWRTAGSGAPPGHSLFNITLHCDDAFENATANPVPTMEQMVEMELAGRPWLPSADEVEPEGWGVPFDSCDALLQTMREGSSDLLPSVKYQRAQGY